jgi:hypothetical protein
LAGGSRLSSARTAIGARSAPRRQGRRWWRRAVVPGDRPHLPGGRGARGPDRRVSAHRAGRLILHDQLYGHLHRAGILPPPTPVLMEFHHPCDLPPGPEGRERRTLHVTSSDAGLAPAQSLLRRRCCDEPHPQDTAGHEGTADRGATAGRARLTIATITRPPAGTARTNTVHVRRGRSSARRGGPRVALIAPSNRPRPLLRHARQQGLGSGHCASPRRRLNRHRQLLQPRRSRSRAPPTGGPRPVSDGPDRAT